MVWKTRICQIISTDEIFVINDFIYILLYYPVSANNLPSYRACSKFLASVSGYQYTRKAWRKEALELLLDQGFFQMDVHCIGYWRAIIDNLMTHDKTTFKDLMSKFINLKLLLAFYCRVIVKELSFVLKKKLIFFSPAKILREFFLFFVLIEVLINKINYLQVSDIE